MKIFAKIAMMASALLTAQAANATMPNGIYHGNIQVSQSLLTTHTIEIEINNTTANVIKFSGGGGAIIPYNGINVTQSGNTVTFHDIKLYTLGATCQGNLVAEWDGVKLLFLTPLPPGSIGYPPCQIRGIAVPKR